MKETGESNSDIKTLINNDIHVVFAEKRPHCDIFMINVKLLFNSFVKLDDKKRSFKYNIEIGRAHV